MFDWHRNTRHDMDEFLSYIFRNQWVVFIVPALLLIGGAEFGFRLGLHLYASQDEARKAQIGGIQGAVLGLLALLLGFTFAMAVNRYEARREFVVEQANAIGTTFLRASLLPEAHVAPTCSALITSGRRLDNVAILDSN
jgi:hypothetical protein